MSNSEEQFQELLANLVAQVNAGFSKSNKVPTIGLLLEKTGAVSRYIGAAEGDVSDEVRALQAGLIEKAKETNAVAACLAYADYSEGSIVAYLENSENYCLKATIPVITEPELKADVENIAAEQGMVFVFGAGDS